MKKTNQENYDEIYKNAILIENGEIISRYGDAQAEFVKGYNGFDYNTNTRFKGLKDISSSKVHPDYKDQNIKQQAGFSAEVIKVSNDNAERIINGESRRTIRIDDSNYFQKNDTKYDHVEIKGNKLQKNSASQMKFVSNPKKLLNKIAMGEGGGKNDLSRYQGITLDLPSEQVEIAKTHCRQQSQRLRDKAARLENKGDVIQADKCRKQAENFDN